MDGPAGAGDAGTQRSELWVVRCGADRPERAVDDAGRASDAAEHAPRVADDEAEEPEPSPSDPDDAPALGHRGAHRPPHQMAERAAPERAHQRPHPGVLAAEGGEHPT